MTSQKCNFTFHDNQSRLKSSSSVNTINDKKDTVVTCIKINFPIKKLCQHYNKKYCLQTYIKLLVWVGKMFLQVLRHAEAFDLLSTKNWSHGGIGCEPLLVLRVL